MNRAKINPILETIPAARQEVARHYGVHPYFTRRPSNVVRAYVERYSKPDDVVLDPFGGTGVTAIEAFLLGRHAIHNDLNPFANFIASNIADTTLHSASALRDAFGRVEDQCRMPITEIESDEARVDYWLKRVPLPENIRLPRTSDAEFFYDMFTPRQLAGVALLKQAIDREESGPIRNALLLAWSASVAKLNKTFLSAKGRAASRGGSSIFSIYRYKLASEAVELPIWETFSGRFQNVLAAKAEILKCRAYTEQQSNGKRILDSHRDFQVLACDASALGSQLKPESVDYIFTDPPYGAFISYLDLSVLWNHWLGFPVTDDARQQETIVGGEQGHSEDHYKKGLERSIETCLLLLKPDRWFSIVFQHWDPSYFATILESTSRFGAELKAAITQTGDVIWSMHKKKNSANVLAGEMILTFYKPRKFQPRQPTKHVDQRDPASVLSEVFDTCLDNGAEAFSSELLFNRLIMELWHRRALGCLNLGRKEFADELSRRGWTYDPRRHEWHRRAKNGDALLHAPTLFKD